MIDLTTVPRRIWNACNYDEMKLLALVLGDRIANEEKATLVDVGAHFGTSCAPFLEKGWRVLALEPDAANRQKLSVLGERFPTRLSIVAKAASEKAGVLPLYASTTSTGISSLHAFHETHEASGTVETVPLGSLLAEHRIDTVSVLKIDVEGHEMTVLRSMDWSVCPRVVVCEFDESKSVDDGPSRDSVCGYLASAGYRHVIVSEWFPVVEYGLHHRPRRISTSSGVLPHGAWGNILAFDNLDDQVAFVESAAKLIARSRLAQPITKQISKARQTQRSASRAS